MHKVSVANYILEQISDSDQLKVNVQEMAKSLRSKSKRAFRRIKREDPKSDYAIRDKIRVARLSEKLKVLKDVSDSEEDVVEEQQEDGQDGDDDMAGIEAEASTSATSKPKKANEKAAADMAIDGETPVDNSKVSTHGPKDSARLDWRKKRGLPAGRKRTEKNSTVFGKQKSYKSTGKAKKKGRV